MAVKSKSRSEKIGSGLGLVFGIIGFNMLVPVLFGPQAGFELVPMILAMVSAVVGSELGAMIGKRIDAHKQAKP
ncbi:hypothetical protein ACK32A_04035 [Aeromonas enteropelogenes]|uniref:hypothetical protein n=1 Tax=Aeromonas enteropelogenes TaxID=29489 RepID=UPI0039899AF6